MESAIFNVSCIKISCSIAPCPTRSPLRGVMGLILSLSGLTTHQMLAVAHWHAVEQELESISGTLHDTLEPKLIQPNRIEPAIKQALPGLCLAELIAQMTLKIGIFLALFKKATTTCAFFTQLDNCWRVWEAN